MVGEAQTEGGINAEAIRSSGFVPILKREQVPGRSGPSSTKFDLAVPQHNIIANGYDIGKPKTHPDNEASLLYCEQIDLSNEIYLLSPQARRNQQYRRPLLGFLQDLAPKQVPGIEMRKIAEIHRNSPFEPGTKIEHVADGESELGTISRLTTPDGTSFIVKEPDAPAKQPEVLMTLWSAVKEIRDTNPELSDSPFDVATLLAVSRTKDASQYPFGVFPYREIIEDIPGAIPLDKLTHSQALRLFGGSSLRQIKEDARKYSDMLRLLLPEKGPFEAYYGTTGEDGGGILSSDGDNKGNYLVAPDLTGKHPYRIVAIDVI